MEQVKIHATVKGETDFQITIYKCGDELKTVRIDNKAKSDVEVETETASKLVGSCVSTSFAIDDESFPSHSGHEDDQTISTGNISLDGEFTYNMNHPNRGLFVVFNHQNFDKCLEMPERKGTNIDKSSLEIVAKYLGFNFKVHDDCTRREIIDHIDYYANNVDHSDNDCFVCVILSHGVFNDRLCGYDMEYDLNMITEPFQADKCTSLAGKPKLFFTQACRGQKFMEGVIVEGDACRQDQPDSQSFQKQSDLISIPVAADFLFAHATPANYYAWRNSGCGSIFIQVLCDCLLKFGRDWDLLRLLTLVTNRVALEFSSRNINEIFNKKKQIPSMISQLRGRIVFTSKHSNDY